MKRRPARRRKARPKLTELLDEAERSEVETGPLRRCLVTRERHVKSAMLRFVVAPDETLVFDVNSTLPGRGLWLSARADVIYTALKRGVFPKAAKQRVIVAPDLSDRVIAALEQRIAELLGLARRSGAAVSGFEKVRELIAAGRCALLVEARDGSIAERVRLLNGRMLAVATPLHAARLGAMFGRDHAVHVGLAPGRLAEMIDLEAARLTGIANPPVIAPVIANDGKSGQRDAHGAVAAGETSAEL